MDENELKKKMEEIKDACDKCFSVPEPEISLTNDEWFAKRLRRSNTNRFAIFWQFFFWKHILKGKEYGSSLSEISEKTGIELSQVFRLLKECTKRGLLFYQRDGLKCYSPFIKMGLNGKKTITDFENKFDYYNYFDEICERFNKARKGIVGNRNNIAEHREIKNKEGESKV